MPHKDLETKKLYHQRYKHDHKERLSERSRKSYLANKEARIVRSRVNILRTKYNLTPDDVEAMKASQRGLCKICQQEKPLDIDHCHKTGKIRGLLCRQCNTAIGSFSDDILRLQSAIAYLRGDAA